MPKSPVLHAGKTLAAERPSHLRAVRKAVPVKTLALSLFGIFVLVLLQFCAGAQMIFTAGNLTQTENFNGMTANALPSGFTINAVSGLSTSVDFTTSSLNISSTGRSYKFTSGSDYAIGFLNSSSFTSPRSIYLVLQNNTGADITGFTINFDYEKYRTGMREFDFVLNGCTDNVSYLPLTGGSQNFPADGNNTGATPFPQSSTSKTATVTGITIASGSNYYLRWTLTGLNGSSNGQALAIDNISITAQQASAACTAPSGLAANNITSSGANLSWSAVSGATGYEYVTDQSSGAPSGSGTATTATGYTASSLNASTTYYLHVRTNCGSGNYSSWTTFSFNTTAGCTPPAATITPAGPTTFCSGSNVVLNANTGASLTYQWRLNGANISNATNSSYTANAAGNYKVLVSNGSCSDSSAATTVTVNAIPTAVITPSGPTSFCNGGSVILTGSSNNGLYYQWRLNGTDIPGASTNTYTASAAGNYKVVVTNAALCTDSSAATTITINTPPTAEITPAGPTVFCAGGNVVLNANTGAGLTYQWRLNGANISNATNSSYTANAAGNYKVVVSNGACSDSSAATTVFVNAAPTAVITPSGPVTFCSGGNVILNANTGAGLTYQWRLNGANISNATSSSYTANAAGDYKVVVSNGACSDSSAATTVSVNALPTAVITPSGPTAFCNGGSVMLTGSSNNGLYYQWRLNGTDIPGASTNTYTASTAGNYKVVVTNAALCTDSSAATTITINTPPTATITPAGPTSFCSGGNVVLNANTGAGLTYQWKLNGANISNATNNSYTASASGDYKVVVSNGSCGDSSAATTVAVNALPTAVITPAGPTTFCNGGSAVLNANTGAGLTYQWRLNGANISNATNSSYTASVSGDYKVVVSNGSCSDSSAAITITANVMAGIAITPAGPTTFCNGGNVVLNATTGAGLTYQWRLNGANINSATNNTYTATAAGDYKVIVTNGTSCSDSSAAVTVTVNATPTATITPGGATSFCTGGSVVLNANTGAGLTYQWRLNGANIGGATTASYTANATGNYKVVVSNSSCSDSSTATTVNVNTLPSATITPAGPTTFCTGGGVVLNANTGAGLTYQWRLNGTNISNATNASYTANASGNYKVVVSNSSCTDSSTATTVTINVSPTATITPAGPTTFCTGGSVVLNANTGAGLTYQWKLNGANIGGATTASYTANATGNYKVVVSNSSCTDSSTATTVTVNAVPTATITPAGATTFCSGGSVLLNANTGAGLTYQWRLNGANIGGATTASYTANASGNYKVVVSNSSCADSSTATTVTVNAVPTATITPAGPTTFCTGGSVVLNANTGAGLTYQWKLNGANIGGATTASYTANATGNYKVVVSNSSCTDSSTATTVTVNAVPTATITPAGPTIFCAGGSVILNANTGAGLTYQWRLNGANIGGATTASYTANATGNYKVVVSNSSCTDSSTATTVTVNALPTATITPAGLTTFCAGGSVVLNANTGAGLTYQWRMNGANISGATASSYTANASGNYKVVVTNASTCTDSSTATTVTVNALPTATITPASATTFCAGGNVVLNANTGAGLTYQWRLNGANISGATNASYTANASGAYKVVVTNTSTCTDSSAATTVTVNALPTAAITPAGATTFCAGGNVVLNANTGAGLTYQWRLNGANISGATASSYTANASGNYKVVVTNASTCSDSSAATTVTVNALPTATITPAGPTTFCAGGNVVLNANTGAGLTYQWRLNGANISGATAASYTAIALGTYKVVVTNASTCTDSSAATTVTVNALPTATITPAGPTTFCAGSNVMLNANTGTGLTYQWRMNGANISGATAASYTANASGAYKVVVTNASTCADSSTAITITVNALPTATITPAGPTTFCIGGNILLNANTGAGLTYQWMLNGASIGGATNASYTASTSGNYKVAIQNSSLCTDTSTAITVTVNALPTASITPAGATTFCAGGNVILNANTSAGLTYQWRRNGVNITGATNSAYTATIAGDYKVVVTNASTCADSSTAVTVTVNALPTAAITPAGPTSFCAGSDVVLTANSGSGLTYQWRVNGNNIAGATTVNYTANASGTYKVMVTNTTGCSDSSAGIVVTVNPLPVASITAMGTTTFCSYDSVQLNAGTAAGVTYQWQFNGGNITGATNNTYYAATPGAYTVQVSNGNCTAVSPSISIATYQVLTPIVTQHGDTLSTPSGYTGYQWYLGGQSVAGATSNVFTPAHSGYYTVIVTDTSGCTATSAINYFLHTGITNVQVSDAIKMYPNPAATIVHIDAPIPVRVLITTADGSLVLTHDGGDDINISSLAQGVYFVRITDKNGQLLTTRRLLKTAE